jgi:predicted nucleic acid-binding protein
MSLVLDSSATLAWIFGDETTESIRTVFEQVVERGAFVPTLWRLEVANSLTTAARRGRIDPAFRDSALADLGAMGVIVDSATEMNAWGATLSIADRCKLTVYDAAYVELAQRRGLPLATLDGEMAAACDALGLRRLGA